MSFEGYTQRICKNGHYYEADVYQTEQSCPHCKAEAAWENLVDQTNCEDAGLISRDQIIAMLLDKGPVLCRCECGHSHTKEQAVFKIPTPEEVQQLRKLRQ